MILKWLLCHSEDFENDRKTLFFAYLAYFRYFPV